MDKNEIREKLKELTLMLLYLNSWEEKEFDMKYRRSWKGYDFAILNELIKEGSIDGSYKSKSVYIHDQGVEKAREIMKKYGLGEILDEMIE